MFRNTNDDRVHMSKLITILFPEAGNKPVGGHKVILQYANEFAKCGYKVNVVYSCYYDIPVGFIHKMLRLCKYSLKYLYTIFFRDYSCKSWFNLDTSVECHYVWSLYSSVIPKADYYFATAAVSAKSLERFDVPATSKFYFVQGYEPWQIGENGLFETYRLKYTKIVVSNWLKSVVDKYSSESVVVPNGFNRSEFTLEKSIESRDPHIVSILYHTYVGKGFSVGLEALEKVKQFVPDLKVLAFGVYDKPSYLPEWFEYYQSPDRDLHNWINNEASIYLGTSSMEGYGLTIGEAMMCGQAVVCTDNSGYLEMAIPNVSALVCPVGDSQALADAIVKLVNDDDLRINLAKNGNQTIQNYTVDRSFAKLKALLKP